MLICLSRIIQMYALREESGTLVPESVDNNKVNFPHMWEKFRRYRRLA